MLEYDEQASDDGRRPRRDTGPYGDPAAPGRPPLRLPLRGELRLALDGGRYLPLGSRRRRPVGARVALPLPLLLPVAVWWGLPLPARAARPSLPRGPGLTAHGSLPPAWCWRSLRWSPQYPPAAG